MSENPLRGVVAGLRSGALAMAALAFLLLGGWAMFANAGAPLQAALASGLAQGIVCAAAVLAMKPALRALRGSLSGAAALIAPPLIVAAMSLAALVIAHLIVRTPEIARAITPAAAGVLIYAGVLSFISSGKRRG